MFEREAIILNCHLTDKKEIITFLAQKAFEAGYVSNVETYVASVLHREAEYSTGVGFSIAIPHGKDQAVNKAFVMFTRVNDVDWQSLDGTSVDMVFQIGVPASDAGDEHLRILAQLSRKLMRDEFRDSLRAASSVNEVISTLKEYELALMFAAERRLKILDLLKANQVITVSELCEHFETSEATIRRDLSLLDAEGKLERTHGGALFSENKTTTEDKVKSREAMAILEKTSIALVAFNLLVEHDSIILDAGTTTLELAKLIGQSKLHLSVVTNSTIAFKELSENPNLDMIMLGGKVRANTLATVGLAADEMLKRFHVDKVFLGTNGITLNAGLTTTDLDEAQIKRSMLSMAKQRIVLLDHSKFNKVYLNQIAPLSMVDVMITDPDSDADLIKAIINAYDIKVLKSEDV